MRIKLFWLGILLAAVTFNSCVKKTFEQETNIPGIDSLNITASVMGRIIDEVGMPIAGATVKGPINTTTTNINGEFSFSDISMNDYAAYITASHSGYFTGSRTFIARQNQKHYIEIQLMKKSSVGILNSTAGGTITLANGVSVLIPSKAVVNQTTGAKYVGDIHVAITWVDPTATNNGRKIPGALRGFNAANNEMGLESYGIVGIEMTGNAGEILQLDTFKTAIVTFPTPTSLKAKAPASKIDLWSYNETKGFWKNEGFAIQSGNTYVATISHLSFWNCADPYNGVRFSATIKDQRNVALKQTLVRVKRVLNNTYTYCFTDTSGLIAGLVPINEPLVLEVMGTGSCSNEIIHYQNVGPYLTVTASAGTIYVNNSGTYGTATITGKVVNCANQPVNDGFVYFDLRGLSYQAAITNGNYTLTIPMCKSSDTISYYTLDLTSMSLGSRNAAVVYTGTNTFGSIRVCGNSYNRFIYYYIDKDTSISVDSINSPSDSTSGFRVNSVFPRFTTITGIKSSRSISFNFLGDTTGTFNVSNLFITHPYLKKDTTLVPTIAVNVTSYSPIGGFISGSFQGSFLSDTIHTIYGVFKVRRDY